MEDQDQPMMIIIVSQDYEIQIFVHNNPIVLFCDWIFPFEGQIKILFPSKLEILSIFNGNKSSKGTNKSSKK